MKNIFLPFIITLIALANLFMACKKDDLSSKINNADIILAGSFGESTAFEYGHITDFFSSQLLKGSIDSLFNETGDNGNIKLTLIIPPYDLSEIYSNLTEEEEPQKVLLLLKNTGKTLDKIDMVIPNPGSGMGSFPPPGTVGKGEIYYTITGIIGVDEEHIEELFR